jgi:uncharacterized coiled-coil DUF342 family protein
MFRIKNIRNSTVNKQTNISPSVNVNQPCGIKIVEKVEVSTKTNRQLKPMTEQQLAELIEKASGGTITPEEELELLKALNEGAESLKSLIAKLKALDSQSN